MPRPHARSDEAGQALLIVAVMIVVLLASLGLAIDAGRAYLTYRNLQNAGDAGSLAGADVVKFDTAANARRRAIAIAAQNLPGTADPGTEDYSRDVTNLPIGQGYSLTVTITVNNGTTQVNTVAAGQMATTILQALGLGPSVSLSASAQALAGNPPFTPAVIGLAPCGGSPYAIKVAGDGALTVNGPIQSNGDTYVGSSSALTMNGNAYSVCGFNGSPTYSPGYAGFPSSPRISDPAYPSPQPLPTNQLGAQHYAGAATDPAALSPGIYSSLSMSGGCYFLNPGAYEFAAAGNGGYSQSNGFVTNELSPPGAASLWGQAGCGYLDVVATPGTAAPALPAGSYFLEVTSTRTDGGTVRESAPTGCLSPTLSVAGSIHLAIPNVPGATGYNVYANSIGCAAPFSRVAQVAVTNPAGELQGSMGVTQVDYVGGTTGPSPPSGDAANAGLAVGTGFNQVTPGAVIFVMKPTSNISHSGGSGLDAFSGYQYNWLVVWSAPANNSSPGCDDSLTGGSLTHLTGTVYSPVCQVSVGGSSTASIQGQLVAWNVVFTGSSGTSITLDSIHTPSLAARLTR